MTSTKNVRQRVHGLVSYCDVRRNRRGNRQGTSAANYRRSHDEKHTCDPRSAALISSILLAVAFIVSAVIYLVGNLRDAMGPFAYAVADFLYGPAWAASLVTLVFALREHIGARAPRRMSLALLAAVLAAEP
jgi:hypothetical protein